MNFLNQLHLRNKLVFGFAIPTLLIVALAVSVNYSLNRLRQASAWVEHTHEAIEYGDSLLKAMIDMETGLRGYLITGAANFLEPYEHGQQLFVETLDKVRQHVSDNPAQLRRIDGIEALKNAWLAEHAKPAIKIREQVNAGAEIGARHEKNQQPLTIVDVAAFISRGLGKKSMDQIRAVVTEFTDAENSLMAVRHADTQSVASLTRNVAIFGTFFALLCSGLMVWLLTRMIAQPLGKAVVIAQAVADLKLDNVIEVSSKDETGQLLQALSSMQDGLRQRLESEHRAAAEMTRITQALDNASSAVLVADVDHTIIYQNRAAKELMRASEADLRQALPGFSAAAVVGSTLDQLQTRNGITRSHYDDLQAPLFHEAMLGRHTFKQVFSPIIDEQGQRLGTVMEWNDRTDEVIVEQEIQAVVDAALAGDLSKRLELEGKEGFYALLGERMNTLVSRCENVINDTVRMLGALSRCDLTVTITGDYQGAFQQLKSRASETVAQLTEVIGKVKADAGALDKASNQINALNKQMHATIQENADQSHLVSASAEEISANVDSVAVSVKQMSASIEEIARNASEATLIASQAVQLAESTDATVRKLSDSSSDIGNVIKVINSIAEQTNLLALNATIEAARAGEAGKGFAVVANEVKELAKETSKATEEIGQKIATIQLDSQSAVSAISEIDQIIQQVNNIQTTIASAVEEQTAATNEIAYSVSETAQGTSEIASNITQIADGAQETMTRTQEAQRGTEELSQLAGELSNLVERFNLQTMLNEQPQYRLARAAG